MTVCQFFLQGRCKFGTDCRNEHPGVSTAFNGASGTSQNTTTTNATQIPALFTIETMTKDLNAGQDRPLWPLSSYGPAKHEPVLISGLDESPEELRVKAAQAVASEKLAEYQSYENAQMAKAEAAINNVKSNITQAYNQAIQQSPLLKQMNTSNTTTASPFGKSAFGAFGGTGATTTPATTSAFGQSAFGSTPSVFGSNNASTTKPPTGSAFGQSAFGGSAAPAPAPAFGQSAFGGGAGGGTGGSAFGQSSFGSTAPASSVIKPATGGFGAFASSGPSAFGAAAAAGPSSTSSAPASGGFGAFAGKPSVFGAGASTTTTGGVFGQSSFSGGGSGSGSVFGGGGSGGGGGVFGSGGNTFGTGSNALEPRPPPTFGTFGGAAPATTSAFGQPATTQPTTSAFGQPVQPTTNTSVFGAQPTLSASAFGAQQPTTSAFGAPTTTSAFGAPAATSAFGAPATTSPFGQPASTSVFGQSAFSQPTSAFGARPSNPSISAFGSSFSSAPAPAKSAQPGPPSFAALKAAPSPYKPNSGLNPYDAKLAGGNYSQILPNVVLEAFKQEKYEWGKVPEWAPPLEMR